MSAFAFYTDYFFILPFQYFLILLLFVFFFNTYFSTGRILKVKKSSKQKLGIVFWAFGFQLLFKQLRFIQLFNT